MRITEIEYRSFTPLMMSPTGGIGQECKKLYSHSAEMISSKKGTGYNINVAWIRRQIIFLLIKSSNRVDVFETSIKVGRILLSEKFSKR